MELSDLKNKKRELSVKFENLNSQVLALEKDISFYEQMFALKNARINLINEMSEISNEYNKIDLEINQIESTKKQK